MIQMKTIAAAAALALFAPLAACSQEGTTNGETTAATVDGTLASAIGDAPGLTTVSDSLSEAGLGEVFDGPGSYTLLAPGDDAFAPAGEALTGEENRAALVAVLRGHILPGHLTPETIRKAIENKNGPVTMTTLDDGEVTFAAEGDAITVSGADGSKATIDGEALIASNGVVLPLDGLVKKAPPAPTT